MWGAIAETIARAAGQIGYARFTRFLSRPPRWARRERRSRLRRSTEAEAANDERPCVGSRQRTPKRTRRDPSRVHKSPSHHRSSGPDPSAVALPSSRSNRSGAQKWSSAVWVNHEEPESSPKIPSPGREPRCALKESLEVSNPTAGHRSDTKRIVLPKRRLRHVATEAASMGDAMQTCDTKPPERTTKPTDLQLWPPTSHHRSGASGDREQIGTREEATSSERTRKTLFRPGSPSVNNPEG